MGSAPISRPSCRRPRPTRGSWRSAPRTAPTSMPRAPNNSRTSGSPGRGSPPASGRSPPWSRSRRDERRGRREPELPRPAQHPRPPGEGGAAPRAHPLHRRQPRTALARAAARPHRHGPTPSAGPGLPPHAGRRRHPVARRAVPERRQYPDPGRQPRSGRLPHHRQLADARLGARRPGAQRLRHRVPPHARPDHRRPPGPAPNRAQRPERRRDPQGRRGARRADARLRGRRRGRPVFGRWHHRVHADRVDRLLALGRRPDRRPGRGRDCRHGDLSPHPRRAAARAAVASDRRGRADAAVDRRGAPLLRRAGRHHDAPGGQAQRETRRTARVAGAAGPRRILRPHAQEAAVGGPLRPRAPLMLAELRVRDLAVIADVTLPLRPGLNVLSGETGAGKSLLVDALALLLGERASGDVVRPGADKAIVEGAFDLSGHPTVRPSVAALGIETEEESLVVKREVHREGKSRAWVNGSPTTVGVLAQLGARLVDLHGQHETQSLLRPDAQRDILDASSQAKVERVAVRDAWGRWRELEQREAELRARREEVRRKADYLRHVVQEIETAAPKVGEDETLETESKRLAHADELGRLARDLERALDTAGLARTARILGALQRLDPSIAKWQELLDGAFANVEELAAAAREYAAGSEADPARLTALEQRRDVLYRLQQKYGPSIPDLLATRDASARELDLLDSADFDLRTLSEQRGAAAADFTRACAALSAKRAVGAAKLGQAVNQLLPMLGLPGGRFDVDRSPLPAPRGDGAETIAFRIRVNQGLDPRPLARVASGGELSRLMLALKVVLAEHDAVPTLVFDEVDQGIGGEIGNRVGEALATVARARQVLGITHLPQIAAHADHHLVVQKGAARGAASSRACWAIRTWIRPCGTPRSCSEQPLGSPHHDPEHRRGGDRRPLTADRPFHRYPRLEPGT